MTADVERIDFTIEKLHSLWASLIELPIAVYLLEIEVGWACVGPIIIASSKRLVPRLNFC